MLLKIFFFSIFSLLSTNSLQDGAAAEATFTKEELKQALLDSNRDTAPWRIYDGADEEVDLVAEWKVVDAEWNGIFAKYKKKKIFKIKMKFDEKKKQLRTQDEEFTLETRNGLFFLADPESEEKGKKKGVYSFGSSKSKFKGKKIERSYGTKKKVALFTETTEDDIIYEYSFSTEELRDHIKGVVATSDWEIKEIIFKKL